MGVRAASLMAGDALRSARTVAAVAAQGRRTEPPASVVRARRRHHRRHLGIFHAIGPGCHQTYRVRYPNDDDSTPYLVIPAITRGTHTHTRFIHSTFVTEPSLHSQPAAPSLITGSPRTANPIYVLVEP